jgi:NhaA family Na+:H+ antiporter
MLENYLHKPVNYLILPIFAFANAGIIFSNISLEMVYDPLVSGIAMALFFGKQLGIISVIFILVKLKIIHFFKKVSWMEFYGVSLLTGIGFTMSLFIGGLAFGSDSELSNQVVIGVISGSAISAILGFIVISLAIKDKNNKKHSAKK